MKMLYFIPDDSWSMGNLMIMDVSLVSIVRAKQYAAYLTNCDWGYNVRPWGVWKDVKRRSTYSKMFNVVIEDDEV